MSTTLTGSFCSQCGGTFSPSDLVTISNVPVCAACKPILLRRLQEGQPPASSYQYMGFWIRVAAKLLDGFLLSFLIFPVYFIWFTAVVQKTVVPGQPPNPAAAMNMLGTMMLVYAFVWALQISYNTFMLGKWGATVGKMAISARVVNADGTAIGYGKSLARALSELFISGMLTIGIGYLLIAFDSQKRGLHDRICGTVVVHK